MRKISIFFLVVLLLAPISIRATESDETEEAIEVLSNDEAGTWVAIGPQGGRIRTVVIDPLNHSTIYAGGIGGVFKSTDGGGSWSATGLTHDVSVLAIDPSNHSTIYAGSLDGLFKSTDGGGNWSATGLTNTSVLALAIDPSNPRIIYASGNGVFGSNDGGDSWSTIACCSYVSFALAINPSNTSIIYEGNNGAVVQWTNGNYTFILTTPNVYALAIDPTDASFIYAGTDGGVFKSTNGGGSWSVINNGLTHTTVNVLTIDPTNTSFIYAGTNGGVFESTNGGGTWSAINSGLTNTKVLALAIDPSDPGIIYAGTDGGGVFKSSSAEGPPSLHVSKSGTGNGTVTSDPAGISCGSTCQANFTTGTNVTLTASADAGSTFTGWSGGGCSGTDPCTISLTSDTTITASFVLLGNCAYTISPTNKAFTSRGGSVSIQVSATGQTNCPAPLVEDAEWISVSGTATWKANKGTVKIAVQKNPNSQSRTGVVSIGGENLTIGEDGAICQMTALKPSSGKYPNTGDGGSFDITVSPQDCGWNVATTLDWIHLDTMTGTGNGTAAFHIDANGTGKNRTGKIDVSLAQNTTKKKTFAVNENK